MVFLEEQLGSAGAESGSFCSRNFSFAYQAFRKVSIDLGVSGVEFFYTVVASVDAL